MRTPKALPGYARIRSIHKKTFNQLAPVYAQRFEHLATKELFLLGPMMSYLRATFDTQPQRVLDIGCGAGGSCSLLQKQGFTTFGIDISPKMIEEAAKHSPKTTLVEGDFLSTEFEENYFHGVCAKAVLHLFDDLHADRMLKKAHGLLVDEGVFYVSVASGEDSQGSLQPKTDYPGQPERFKRSWTLTELLQRLQTQGLTPVYWGEHRDFARDKAWIDCWSVKMAGRAPATG